MRHMAEPSGLLVVKLDDYLCKLVSVGMAGCKRKRYPEFQRRGMNRVLSFAR